MRISVFSGIAMLALSLSLVSCGDSTDTAETGSAADTMQLAPGGETAAPAATEEPEQTLSPVVTHVATMSTSEGDIVIELYGEDAPKTVENFVGLSKKNFYEGIRFHRVAPGFVVQAGDPASKDMSKKDIWGQGGESIYNGEFEDELNPDAPSSKRGYVAGTVAMANSGPNTNSSQFFIVLTDEGASHLPHNYTIFGSVREGMESVYKIEQTGFVNGRNVNPPPNPTVIKSVKIEEVTAEPAAATDQNG